MLVIVDFVLKLHAQCRDKGVEQLILGWKSKRRTGNIFLNIRPEMQQKMKQPSGGHADGCVLHQNFCSIFWGAVVVCHFRACNPIFHTPFLHHFGVE